MSIRHAKQLTQVSLFFIQQPLGKWRVIVDDVDSERSVVTDYGRTTFQDHVSPAMARTLETTQSIIVANDAQ